MRHMYDFSNHTLAKKRGITVHQNGDVLLFGMLSFQMVLIGPCSSFHNRIDSFQVTWVGQQFHFNSISTLRLILDRKSTRLNSSHVAISYAVFCLKKKKQHKTP